MQLTPVMFLIVCPLCFLAGFVDSVAGGGGLISLPAYLAAGLPAHMATGTNKLSACLGTIAASARFIASGKVAAGVAALAVLGALPGSWLGATTQQMIDDRAVRMMMICIIPLVAVFVLAKKDITPHRRISERAVLPMSFAIGLLIGYYDGLVGPGTGTFLILLFTSLLGVDAVRASGTAKLVNLASNIAALTTYIGRGYLLVGLGLPAAVCAIAGNWIGASMTIRRGTGFIRRMLVVVLALLLAKMVFDVVS